MRILGVSAFYHDSAAALIENGHILAAAQEERTTEERSAEERSAGEERASAEGRAAQDAEVNA